MKQLMLCILSLTIALPGLADQTIYCPQDFLECERECKEMVEKDRAITENIQRWEPMLNNKDMMMYKIVRQKGESRQQYLARVKTMQSFYYKGLNYPVRGKFTKDDETYIPLVSSECHNILSLAFTDENKVRTQMDYVKKNTDSLKPSIRNKIEKLKQDQQQIVLFKAQCCGYRWTNEVGNEPGLKPGSKPTGGGKGLLLDVEVKP